MFIVLQPVDEHVRQPLIAYIRSSNSFHPFFQNNPKTNYVTFLHLLSILFKAISKTCFWVNAFFANQLRSSFFISRGCACNWTCGVLCVHHIITAFFELFNPLVDDSTREIYENAEINLCHEKRMTKRCSSLMFVSQPSSSHSYNSRFTRQNQSHEILK